MPKVSVIIPSYNHEKYVRYAIESVLNQTFQDFEIVICDDGSTDNTVREIKKIKDARIKLITLKSNRGVSTAINECLRHIKGKYIAHLNSDDAFLSDKLKKQVAYLDDHPHIGVVFSYAQFIDEKGNVFTSETHHHSFMNHQKNRNRYQWLHYFFYNCRWLWHPSMMLRKSAHEVIGDHDGRLAQTHDFDLGIRLSLNYDIHIIQEPLIQFRIRADNKNVSANTIQAQIRSMFEFGHVLKRFLKIKTTYEFLKIFPQEGKKHKDIIDNDLIPFYVARAALNVEHVFHQKFALDTLYELLLNETLSQKIEKYSHFSYTDFIKQTGTNDIYHVQHIEYQTNIINQLAEKLHYLNSFKGITKLIITKLLARLKNYRKF